MTKKEIIEMILCVWPFFLAAVIGCVWHWPRKNIHYGIPRMKNPPPPPPDRRCKCNYCGRLYTTSGDCKGCGYYLIYIPHVPIEDRTVISEVGKIFGH